MPFEVCLLIINGIGNPTKFARSFVGVFDGDFDRFPVGVSVGAFNGDFVRVPIGVFDGVSVGVFDGAFVLMSGQYERCIFYFCYLVTAIATC